MFAVVRTVSERTTGSVRAEVIGTGLFRDGFDRENGFQSEILTNYGK